MRVNVAEKKRCTNVYLSAVLLEEAKKLDLNISSISNQALEVAVKECKCERWIYENKAGIDALNGFIEEHGLFSDDESFGSI